MGTLEVNVAAVVPGDKFKEPLELPLRYIFAPVANPSPSKVVPAMCPISNVE
jgi:hypothetical protein